MRFILQLAFRSSIRPYSSSLVRKEFVWAFKGKAYFSKVKPIILVEQIVEVWELIWEQENRNTWFLAISSPNSWGFMFFAGLLEILKENFASLWLNSRNYPSVSSFCQILFFFFSNVNFFCKNDFFLGFQMWFCFVFSKNSIFFFPARWVFTSDYSVKCYCLSASAVQSRAHLVHTLLVILLNHDFIILV